MELHENPHNKTSSEEGLPGTAACRKRKFSTNLTVCMTEKPCRFAFTYGHIVFCRQPSLDPMATETVSPLPAEFKRLST